MLCSKVNILAVLTLLLASCAAPHYGFSGLADIDGESYLVVHDTLSFRDGPRVSVIHIIEGKDIEITPVEVRDWNHEDGRASDLEAACALEGRPGEFLIVEAGHWNDQYGRLFHLKVDLSRKPHRGEIITAYELKEFNFKGDLPDGSRDTDGDDVEGIACALISGEKYRVLLGERGGSTAFPIGLIRWIELDLETKRGPVWTTDGEKGIEIDAPGQWIDATKNRDISGLHLDSDDVLWATAAEEFDEGDAGPFYSVVYRIGKIDISAKKPLPDTPAIPYTVRHTISGFKVEGLASRPTEKVDQSEFSISTEDEDLSGAWRPLRKPPPEDQP